eukprot:scaffold17388_cov46-Attheya_sp.AAC.1
MPYWSDDDGGYGGCSSYYGGGYSYSGRGRYRRSEEVTFYRPDRSTESKDIGWCLDHKFYEIEEGLWSGDWYYRHYPDKKKRPSSDPISTKRKRTVPVESYEERAQKRKKKLRDEIDSSCDPNGYTTLQARRELAQMEGTLCKCLVVGCKERFLSEDEMMTHLTGSRGSGHIRYCNSNAIESLGKAYLEDLNATTTNYMNKIQARMSQHLNTDRTKFMGEVHTNVSLSKKKVSPPKKVTTLSSDQKDIRSFFKPI